MENKINKKMNFAQIMQEHPEVVETLFENGLHCCGCPMSQMETLEQGAMAHGLNVDELVSKLNANLFRKKVMTQKIPFATKGKPKSKLCEKEEDK